MTESNSGERANAGDPVVNMNSSYAFVAIERHSKLILNFALGKRDPRTIDSFIEGLREATAQTPFQITTDGFAPYRSAITTTLHDRITGFVLLLHHDLKPWREKNVVCGRPQ